MSYKAIDVGVGAQKWSNLYFDVTQATVYTTEEIDDDKKVWIVTIAHQHFTFDIGFNSEDEAHTFCKNLIVQGVSG